MPGATIHVTDDEHGQVLVELEADRDLRKVPDAKRTPAERCAAGVFAELQRLAEHLPALETEDRQ